MTVFVENQFKPLRANNMKQFNQSIFKSSLSRISAKNGERHSFSSLVSYSTMSLFRLLLSAHDCHTFIHILVVLTVFLFTAFSASFCIPHPRTFRESWRNFLKTKAQTLWCSVLPCLTCYTIHFLLLYHYYEEIVILPAKEISKISRVTL